MELTAEKFVCIDCETTGLDRKIDRVVEVAVAAFTISGGITEQFETLLNPQCLIPEETVAIHHITNEMIQGKPVIQEILPGILKLIGSSTIIGHGICFDIEILHEEALRSNIPSTLITNPFIDTLRLARLYGESPVNSLQRLRQHFNIGDEGAHRAMSDVIVNIAVFKQLVRGFKTKQQLMNVLSKPIQMKVMPLGKHKGRLLREIPLDYLQWAVRKDFDEDLLFSLRLELNRRKKGGQFLDSANPFAILE